MLIVLSPAKRLVSEGKLPTKSHTFPEQLDRSAQLVGALRKLSEAGIASLMDISPELARLNRDRFQAWSPEFNPDNARPALLSFQGDVYQGLDAASLSAADLQWAQNHLRILSGLHGVLRPLDLMKPYRLEMGTKLAYKSNKNLYDFWTDSNTASVAGAVRSLRKEEPLVLNLASAEYWKSVRPSGLGADVISADFREFKAGVYKPIQLYLKQARGYMARWVIQERITRREDLPGFDREGYRFEPALSKADKLVFVRG
jgi:uncharacterized protein